jgi:hypothetical protein
MKLGDNAAICAVYKQSQRGLRLQVATLFVILPGQKMAFSLDSSSAEQRCDWGFSG